MPVTFSLEYECDKIMILIINQKLYEKLTINQLKIDFIKLLKRQEKSRVVTIASKARVKCLIKVFIVTLNSKDNRKN